MTGVLFVTVDAGGNLPPALALAAETARRGWQVRFLGSRLQRERIERAGFRFQVFKRGADYDASAPRSTIKAIRDMSRLFSDKGIAQDAIEAAAAEPTDAVVVDTLLYRALGETVRAGLPVVQFMHMFSGFAITNATGPFGLVNRLRGSNPPAALRAPKLTLVATRPELDANAMPGVRHTGFVWQGIPVAAKPKPVPRILVSFSTTAFPGQPEALQRTVDGLGALEAEVVVTTGASIDPATIRPAPNTTLHRFADHGELLQEASLVVGHGGHSTAARALSYGVPVLVLPMHSFMDQPLVGKAIQNQCIGLTIPKRSSARAIRQAAERLLTDQAIRGAAAVLGRDIRSRDGATVAADLLEEFAGRSARSLRRRSGRGLACSRPLFIAVGA
jgi:UDP:flavonoid glycosyltransferase YjiC (YdhE family)